MNNRNFTSIRALDYLKSLKSENAQQCADVPFVNLQFCLRSVYEVAELVEAIDENNINNLITYPLHRLALFETVSFVVTEIQLRDEQDLADVVKVLYRDNLQLHLKNIVKIREKQENILEIAYNISHAIVNKSVSISNNLHYYSLYERIYNKIKLRINNKEYQLHTCIDIVDENGNFIENEEKAIAELSRRYLQDEIYRKLSSKFIRDLIDRTIAAVIDSKIIKYKTRADVADSLSDKPLTFLSSHPGESRCSFMLVGAPATGKGTYNTLCSSYAKDNLGIDWADTLKINTDSYRQFVSQTFINNKIVNDDIKLSDETEINYSLNSSAFNNDDTRYILNRIYDRLAKKLENNKSPHLFIDCVMPSNEKFEMGTKDFGSLYVVALSAPVAISVERAYRRGLQTGRYVNLPSMLEAHKSVSENFFSNIAKYKNKKVKFILCDTHMVVNSFPRVIATGDMYKNKIFILDHKRAGIFYAKKDISIKPQDSLSSYDNLKGDSEYKSMLKKEKVNVIPIKLKKPDCTTRNTSLLFGGTPKGERKRASSHSKPANVVLR